MKLAPSNFPGRAIVMNRFVNTRRGTDLWIRLGDADDPKAISVFVEGDHIHNADYPYTVLDCW